MLEHGLDRSWLGNLAAFGEETTASLLGEHARVLSAGPDDIVLLEGERWPVNEGGGASLACRVFRRASADAQ